MQRDHSGPTTWTGAKARAGAGALPGHTLHDLDLGWLQWVAGWFRASIAEEINHRTGFLWLPVAFGLGVMAYFAARDEPSLWAGPLAAALSLGLSFHNRGIGRMVALAIAMMALGFSAGTLRTLAVASPMLDRSILAEMRGHIETIDMFPARHRLTIRPVAIEGLEAKAIPFRVRIGAPGLASALPGDFVVVQARLAPPSEAAMPGGYDFRRESFFRGIGGVGYAVGKVQLAAEPSPAAFTLRVNAAIDRWRNALTDRIARAIGGEAGALSAALVTGKRGLIPEQTNEELRASGLYHIVSISGLHMVLAAGVLFWLTRAGLAANPGIALRYPIKKIAALVAMAGATFYCIFSGSEVATERSLIMTLVMLGAILVDRPALAMRNLAISALIVLAREPESLLGPSFQMSYAAVASLIAANQIWQNWRARRPHAEFGLLERIARRILLAFLGIIATTLIATMATAPFSAFHFHRLNPYGLIGNSLAIPLVSLIVMPSAVAGSLLVPFGLDWIIWSLMGQGVAGVLVVAERVAGIENASFPVARMPDHAFALLVLGLLVLVGFRTGLRWFSLAFLLLWAITLRLSPLPDLMIDPAGRMMLVRGEDGRYRLLAAGNVRRFTLAQWLPSLGDKRKPDDPSLRSGTSCDNGGCTIRLHDGVLLAHSLRADALREDCRRADIVITPLPTIAACTEKPILSRQHFESHGATRATRTARGEWHIETGLDPMTDRPWRRKASEPGPSSIARAPSENSMESMGAWDTEAVGRIPARRAAPRIAPFSPPGSGPISRDDDPEFAP